MFDKEKKKEAYVRWATERGAGYVIEDMATFVHNVDDLEFIATMLESSLRMGGQTNTAVAQLEEDGGEY